MGILDELHLRMETASKQKWKLFLFESDGSSTIVKFIYFLASQTRYM